jgi:hypothetical protein
VAAWLKQLDEAKLLYSTPRDMNDDMFWMYATIHFRSAARLVRNKCDLGSCVAVSRVKRKGRDGVQHPCPSAITHPEVDVTQHLAFHQDQRQLQ